MSLERVVVAVRGTDGAATSALVARAVRRGFARIALPRGTTLSGLGESERWEYSDDVLTTPQRTVTIESIGDPKGLAAAEKRAAASGGPLAVRWVGEHVLPLENLLAQSRGRFEVWVIVRRIEEVAAALGSLEQGADLVVAEIGSEADLDRLEAEAEPATRLAEPLRPVPVVRVTSGGVGDRVIVDTTSLLSPDEGLLVGSAATFLFLVVSEAVGSRYTRPRPFRVNAGATHSYTLLADGTTRYLSELEPGDPLLLARADGRTRRVRVGRLKVERRPLRLIQAEVDGRRPTLFLQEAETVRLWSTDGPVAATELGVGATVLGAALPAARHLGSVIAETIDER